MLKDATLIFALMKIISIYIGIISLRIELLHEVTLHHARPVLTFFPDLSHNIFLQTSRQIICVWKEEPLLNIDLLKIIDIPILIISILGWSDPEHWHQLHILDLVYRMFM